MRVVMFGPPAAMLVAGPCVCVCERALGGALTEALAWLGNTSFSLYLSHTMTVPILIYFWFIAFGVTSPWLTTPPAVAAAIAVGTATDVFIEGPILNHLRRIRFGLTQSSHLAA